MNPQFNLIVFILLLIQGALHAECRQTEIPQPEYPRYKTPDLSEQSEIFISAKDAARLIDNPKVVFLAADDESIFTYKQYIRNAINLPEKKIYERNKDGSLKCKPEIRCVESAQEYLGREGITNDLMIIVYERSYERFFSASVLYLFFKSIGHEDVRILDGGLKAISDLDPLDAKYMDYRRQINHFKRENRQELKELERAIDDNATDEVIASYAKKARKAKKNQSLLEWDMRKLQETMLINTDTVYREPVVYHINNLETDRYFVTKEAMLDAVNDIKNNGNDSPYILLDVRTMREMSVHTGLDNILKGGYIPGALRATLEKFPNKEPRYADNDKEIYFMSADDLKVFLDQHCITKDKTLYLYSHHAARSAHLYILLKILKYPNVKIYSGGWKEWANDRSLPAELLDWSPPPSKPYTFIDGP